MQNQDEEAFLSRLLHRAVHDLKAPVRHSEMFCEILSQQLSSESFTTEVSDTIDSIHRANRSQRVILDSFGKFVRHVFSELEIESLNFDALISEAWETTKDVSRRDDVDFELLTSVGSVKLDREKMKGALQELFDNACSFRSSERPHAIKCNARTSLNELTGVTELVVSIIDNGIGVDPQLLDRIPQPFEKLPGPRNAPRGGLGLTAANRIVQRHGGRLDLSSDGVSGFTAKIVLPIASS